MICATSPVYEEVELYAQVVHSRVLTVIAHVASRSAPIKRDYELQYPLAN